MINKVLKANSLKYVCNFFNQSHKKNMYMI